jgi:hypothetical protein
MREMPLVEAIEKCEYYDGTILSCLPGKLAYYHGEDERLIFEKK